MKQILRVYISEHDKPGHLNLNRPALTSVYDSNKRCLFTSVLLNSNSYKVRSLSKCFLEQISST